MIIWLTRISLVYLLLAVGLTTGDLLGWIPLQGAWIWGSVVLASSGLALMMQGTDKWSARNDLSRVPEKWLHALELAGGWPGSHFGQQWFRHKTSKTSYRVSFYAMIVLHLAAVAAILFWDQYK